MGNPAGADGRRRSIFAESGSNGARHIATVGIAGVDFLRRMWIQQYWTEGKEDGRQHLHLRADDNQPPGAQRLHSPYDEEVRYSAKREMGWVEYKAQLSETSEVDQIHLITQVTASMATEADMTALKKVHCSLEQKDLLPDEHLLDAGYVDAESLVSSKQDFGVTICSPVREKVSWQTKAAEGFDLASFQIDWKKQRVICPQGQSSAQWCERHSENRKPAIQVRFSTRICRVCADHIKCTRAKSGARTITFLPRDQYLALQKVRKEQGTQAFWDKYARRSGIEGTISQAVRGYELRYARYIGLGKTNLQIIATATAINLHLLFDWWQHRPRAKTRTSVFAKLAPSPSLLAAPRGAA